MDTTTPAAAANPRLDAPALVTVNGIEVIYNHVILVLKGVSLSVPEGGVVAILGGNGAGKTTTLRAISNLLAGERGCRPLDQGFVVKILFKVPLTLTW